MKKLLSVLGVVALVLGIVAFALPSAKAAAPAGTMTSTALTVDLGQLKAINAITVTDSGAEIDATTDIKIRIPAGVNAVWDTADTTAVIDTTGNTTGTVSTTVTYESAKIVVLNVTADFTATDHVTVSGLSMIGQTATSVATALDWAVDGATYLAGNANTQVTVADGAEDTLTSVTIDPYDPVTGSTTAYTVTFTVPATGVIPKDGKVVVDLPAGFNTAGALAVASSSGFDGGLAVANTDGTGFTVTRNGAGTNSTAGTKVFVISGIVNGATGAAHTATVSTQTTASAALAAGTSAVYSVLAAPAAIADLVCEPAGQAGAIWLRWAVPTGASTTYTVKHAAAAITNDGEFNAGTTFAQSWTIGTRATTRQELVTGLNPGTRYHFSMKSGGFGPTTSAVSNATANCVAPSSAPGALDTVAPVTQIISPAGNSNVTAGITLKVKGTAKDSGGSSVQRVEVSTNDGYAWANANIVDDDEANIIWEYSIPNVSAGSLTVKARATDWVNNVGTPASITVTGVSGGTTTVTTPSGVAAPGLQTAPGIQKKLTSAEINAQIVVLRQQLIVLLQQLIQMLMAAKK